MVDWISPKLHEQCYQAFLKMGIHHHLGFRIASLDEGQTVQMAHVFYCTCLLDDRGTIVLTRLVKALSNLSLGLASTNLAIRTLAVWDFNRCLLVMVIILIGGHWIFGLAQAWSYKASWIPGSGCVPRQSRFILSAALSIYSVCFDGLMLILNAYKLGFRTSPDLRVMVVATGRKRTLTSLVIFHGSSYFIISFLINLCLIIVILLDLPVGAGSLVGVSTAVINTVTACRAVRSLTLFFKPDEDFKTYWFSR
ncbi:hypothetical protein CPB83DRAFT_879195 [Crepidotus variabilis]|uniref:Uncharacterized protein n=1 Tax=Crepidotus variabilis TaxID=179855 RepID=A0A9P6EU52_9AGAR|nr:hypothetical protein CPB83DRAFT_879195 [Crepidotus variabilis]